MDKLEKMVLGEGNTKPRNPRVIIADNYNEVVEVVNDIIDEVEGLTYIAPYKVFSCLVSQALVTTPTYLTLENNLGAVTFARTGVGTYTINSTGLFVADKTTPNANPELFIDPVTGDKITAVWTSASVITLTTTDSSDVATDGLLNKRFIEIKVYS